MSPLVRSIPVLLIGLLLSSCSTTAFQVGHDFEVSKFSAKVERGATTQDQIRAWLGDPTSTGIKVESNGERYDEWTYYFAKGQMANLSTTQLKILQIKFDKGGTVQSYSWSVSEH
jgi:outer membrane protein assembly factor BamE (lipoprotein component of BamABCDE complex)